MVDTLQQEFSDNREYIAFLTAERAGDFQDFAPGTWVAFFNAALIATAENFEEMSRQLVTANLDGDIYLTQVNLKKTV